MPAETSTQNRVDEAAPERPLRLRRRVTMGARCPRCAGALASGEGYSMCAECGYLNARATS